jgi:hypothetical protein
MHIMRHFVTFLHSQCYDTDRNNWYFLKFRKVVFQYSLGLSIGDSIVMKCRHSTRNVYMAVE